MITRKIGKLIRGKTTPFQVYAACLLGALLGFLPGFTQTPGLYFLFLALLIILNANLFIAGVFLLLGTLFAELLMPWSFKIGLLLIDGPLHGLFVWLVNAPVLAWFGFDHYVAVGGLVLASLLGLGGGLGITRTLRALRRKLGSLEQDSAAYKAWTAKPPVKVALWLVMGGVKDKTPLAELAELRKGPHFRTLGIALVLLAAILLGTLTLFFSDTIVTAQTQHALQRVNGATVELERAELRLRESRATLRGLAMVNPDQLDENWFAADVIEMKLSTADLLRRKFAFENVEIAGASSGESRRFPGVRVAPSPRPQPDDQDDPEDAEERAIEDYLKEAAVWRERLSRVRALLERWERGGEDPIDERDANWRERISERARQSGYATVTASHLIRKAPNLTLYRLHAGGVRMAQTPDERWDITAHNLSTQPYLLEKAPKISIQSDSGKVAFDLSLGRSSAAREANTIRLAIEDLPVETLREKLQAAERLPFEGGSIDFELEGSFTPEELDLPFQTTFRNTRITVPGVGAQDVALFRLPLGLTGALDQPRLRISDDAWAQALRDAGQARLLQEGRRLLEEQTGGAGEEVRDRARGLLEGLGR